MTKRFLKLWGLCALALLIVSACAPPPPLRDETLLRDTSLTEDNADCQLPCWRGITPGETPWSDALTILEDQDDLSDPTVQQAEEGVEARTAEFGVQGGSACCQILSRDGEIVTLLFLRFAPTTRLGDVIAQHGEPEYVVATPYSDDQSIVNLVFPEQSTVIYAFVAGPSGSISETSEIIGALYMPPSDMELLLVTSSLYAWEGYDTYAAYEGREDAPFDITPSVTLTPTPTE